MLSFALTWTSVSAQINYTVTNNTNSYWKVFINCIDDNSQAQVYQFTVGATPAAIELTDGIEMTQVTAKTPGGTTIATSNEGYDHQLGCSGSFPEDAGYFDAAPSLACCKCVQWANDATGGGCNILYGY